MIDNFFIFSAEYLYIAIGFIAFIFFLKQPSAVRKQIIILAVLALPAVYAAARIIGLIYYNPTPFEVGGFTPLIPHLPDNGFPSDHTLIGAAIASVVYPFSKKVSSIMWALTLLVGVSRVYVGVHHLVDIAGSIAIAILVTLLIYGLIWGWKGGIIMRKGM